MRKCIYITDDGWWDTDITILPQIADDYEITVVVAENTNQLKYDEKKISGIQDIIKFDTKYSNKDFRKIAKSVSFFSRIYRKYIKDKTPPLIFFIKENNIAFLLLSLFLLPKRYTIIGIHDFLIHKGKYSAFYDFIFKLLYQRFENFLFFSETQYRSFNRSYPTKKSFYINMPLKSFGTITRATDKVGYRKFLFFGFIQDYKRLDLFIHAAKQINNAQFIIAGACNEWEKYEKIIERMDNLQCNIHFLKNDEIKLYFQEADYLVLPYDESTQSGPLLIAYNYNIPVIASDIELFKAMVCDKQNGFLFEKGNLGSLIKVLDKANNLSESQYQLLVKNMSERKEQYQSTTNFKLALDTFLSKR